MNTIDSKFAPNTTTPAVSNNTSALFSAFKNTPFLEKAPKVDCYEKPKEAKNNKSKVKFLVCLAALAATACAALVKTKDASNTQKLKQEVIALYDYLFEKTNEDILKMDLNFEKPELIFRSLKKKLSGGYQYGKNKIYIDLRKYKNLAVTKDLDKIHTNNISDKITLYDAYYTANKLDEMSRYTSKDETKSIIGSVLYHELSHAKLLQTVLSTEGGKEKLIEKIKAARPRLTDEAIQKKYPFIFSYEPQKINPKDAIFAEKLENSTTVTYSLDDIIDSFANYKLDLGIEYNTNLAEVSAKNAESRYWKNIINGKIEKPEGIDDSQVNYFYKCAKHNVDVLLGAVEKVKTVVSIF